ncbi:hypothetical protein BO79DRAFT_284039 [Aspergillus costaricaensis CBS 115574]|uniref:Uncharacterized protein n=1 Tax=Aspergillus costaricaensis CBS 115574 TaxID=1448317 RepID=A0ACD1IS24_9EURO|nr:hypothetical protein BO79DRAFT_284039 [Aspergillus costaricaensis CBS 115574]RAK93385.1 hypothetical protein BO79DRAFT_284039 [Aspergillus costaricaensis CBS 115574]
MAPQHHYTLADQGEPEVEVVSESNTNSTGNAHAEATVPQNEKGFSDEPPATPSSVASTLEKGTTSTSHWTIGWMTPSSIITCFLLAASVASMHLGLFHWLDQREVEKTIKQPYVTALSVVFVNGFRTFLAAALGMSFIQMLWKDLRARPMRIGDIDAFLSVLTNPLYLGNVQLLTVAPIPFICALICWCIPIAMIFPAGALTVESKSFHTLANQSVPTFDPAFIGNGTFAGMMTEALWQPNSYDVYSGPSYKLTRVARQAMMAGHYLPASSPCASDCSYSISIPGPSFECRNYSSPDLYNWVNQTYPQTNMRGYLYIASQDSAARTNHSESFFDFGLRWKSDNEYDNLTCRAFEATYNLHITYTGSQQYVTADVNPIRQLNSSYMYDDGGVSPRTGTLDSQINATTTGDTGGNVIDIFRRANLAAIQDSLVLALSGYIDMLVIHGQPSANTIISLTDLYTGPSNTPTFNITGASMQDLLKNITISLLTMNQTTTQVTVTNNLTVNVYSFSRPARLIATYFVCLGSALAFILFGGHALISNGISASMTGMFQTLCTTRASARLDDLAAKGCLGGRENVPDELRNLKVMFGEIQGKDGVRMAGLGSVDEVTPLKRGSI